MVPNINSRGQSFKGVSAYLMHDKKAATSERVVWTETHNLPMNDIEKAAGFMAWTDQNKDSLRVENGGSMAGRKADAGNVYHYSLAWHPDETPTREQMTEAAQQSIERLGLTGHQYYFVAHNDADHAHVHVVANLAHHETGLIANVYKDRNTLDKWAHEWEQEHGVVCEDRDKKYEAWEHDKPAFEPRKDKDHYKGLVTELYHGSDSAAAFQSAMESEGLTLAIGKKRSFVFVDQDGEIKALNRNIDTRNDLTGRKRTAEINAFLKSIDKNSLLPADELANDRKYYDRDAAETKAQIEFELAAQDAAEQRVIEEDAADELRAEELAAQEILRAEAEEQRRLDIAAQRQAAEHKIQCAERVDHWREHWQIDRLTQEKADAQSHFEAHQGWFYKYVFRSKYRDAADDLEAKTLNLEHALKNWRDDIAAIYADQPEQVRREELARSGFSESAVNSGSGQERTQIEAQAVKDEQDNQAVHEAEASEEAAERLADVIAPRSMADRSKIAAIQTRAKSVKEHRAAKKLATEQIKDQQQRDHDRLDDKKRKLRASKLQALAEQEEREKSEGSGIADLGADDGISSPALVDEEERIRKSMEAQRQELDELEASEELDAADMPDFETEEERQMWQDMRQQREELDHDDNDLGR